MTEPRLPLLRARPKQCGLFQVHAGLPGTVLNAVGLGSNHKPRSHATTGPKVMAKVMTIAPRYSVRADGRAAAAFCIAVGLIDRW